MIALIISILLSLGIISSPQDYQDTSPYQLEMYIDHVGQADIESF